MLSPWQRLIQSRNRQVPYIPGRRIQQRFLPTTPGPRYELRIEPNREDDPTISRDSGYDLMMWRAEDELEKWDDFITEMKQRKRRAGE